MKLSGKLSSELKTEQRYCSNCSSDKSVNRLRTSLTEEPLKDRFKVPYSQFLIHLKVFPTIYKYILLLKHRK